MGNPEAEYFRANGGMNPRSRLETFLLDRDPHRPPVHHKRPNKIDGVVGADPFEEDLVEFSSPPSSSERDSKTARESTDRSGSNDGYREGPNERLGEECARDGVCGRMGAIDDGGRGADLGTEDLLDDAADGELMPASRLKSPIIDGAVFPRSARS